MKFRSHTQSPEAQKRLAAERRAKRCRDEHNQMEGRFWINKIKSAERIGYNQPTDGQAVKTILKNTKKFEQNYEKLHDTPV